MTTVALAALLFAADARRPNVLWLIAEDVGVDLACYGCRQAQTPNIDRLAASGMLFSKAYTTCPVCSPSRSAFMTGMYQTTIGAHHHRSHRDDGYLLPTGVKPLTDWFRDAGWYTANVRELPPSIGFRGVGKTDWNFTVVGSPFDSDRWEDLKTHQPFFAQLNFVETHRPFKSPKKTDPAAVEIPPYYPDHPTTRRDWAAYLDSAAELDRKVGLVLALLEKDGLAHNTIVLLFGDNGQAHVRGKQFCYEEGTHVPLIVRCPASIKTKGYSAGAKSDRLISAIDFGPTCLALCDIAKPSGMQGEVFLGARSDPPREHVFGARDRCDETTFRLRTVRDGRFRYIRNFMPDRPFLQPNKYKENSYPVWNLLKELHSAGKLNAIQEVLCAPTMPAEELYDLDADPQEIRNLAGEPKFAGDLGRLRGVLEKWIESTNDQGRFPEPPEIARRQGVKNPKTPPNTGYQMPAPRRRP